MPLILRRSDDLAGVASETPWLAATGTMPPRDRPRRMAEAAQRLHDAFDRVRDVWWPLGRALGAEPSGWLSHAASCASMNSDLGVMLAWDHVARELAADTRNALLICDDPWLFRHLAAIDGVAAGRAPGLWDRRLRLALRGALARIRLAVRLAWAALRLRRQRAAAGIGGASALLVYGHPASSADGADAYFGTLLGEVPGLVRILHIDCDAGRAAALGVHGKAASLHAFGAPLVAFGGLFCRWRPGREALAGPYGWLIRRAADVEGSGAAAAATRWQALCQRRWLETARPRSIAWPWENHPWERALVRDAKRLRIETVGYQHTVVGRQMFNMSPHSNPEGADALPDAILCNGPAYRLQLARLGVPENRLGIAGAFRVASGSAGHHDPGAPVFVALAADHRISRQMMAALRTAAPRERVFLVKAHPMYPFAFPEDARIRRTEIPLPAQPALAAVLYSTGTVGIEALLAGLPTIRFLPEGLIATDIMPDGIDPLVTDADGLEAALRALPAPPAFAPEQVIAPVDLAVWRRYLLAA